MTLVVSELFIYPIKSCAGVAVSAAEAKPRGFAGDRRWMLVDENGVFLTQRGEAAMCLLQPAYEDGNLVVHHTQEALPPLRVPAAIPDAPLRAVRVWGDELQARSAGPEADAWFSRALDRQVHLVWMGPQEERPVDPAFGEADDRVSFADGFPYLILGQAALDGLNARLVAAESAALPIHRFRPNIVFTGGVAHDEDDWNSVHIGTVRMDVVKPCTRCRITTLDTTSLAYGEEPLRTLATYRRSEKGVKFGMNALVREMGSIRIGDSMLPLSE